MNNSASHHLRPTPLATLLLLPVALLGLPLLGLWLTGRPVAEHFEFPPLTRYVPHAPFSWPVFVILALFIAAVVLPFVAVFLRALGRRRTPAATPAPDRAHPFPRWFIPAALLLLVSWLFAWTRFGWFAPLQRYTFIPLWLGYILVVNALTVRRTGRCLAGTRPRFFLLLFPASMLFWWFFEYLNRFVQNWYYLGAEGMGPGQYTLVASLSFGTVLPAVLSTAELLASFPALVRPFATSAEPAGFPAGNARTRAAGGLLTGGAAAGLAGVGVWPDLLFPLLWLAPLLLLTGWQLLTGRATVFDGLARGDWSRVVNLALAALVCGFFWEMWNYWSLARWIYAVPYVHRFQLFEMPLLGYSGYLPFGCECGAAALWLEEVSSRLSRPSHPLSPATPSSGDPVP